MMTNYKKGVIMPKIIKELYELIKEFATIKSPAEVYVFVAGVWISGLIVGSLLG